MIVETLENASLYSTVARGFQQAFQFLRYTDFNTLEDGRYAIEDDAVFAIVTSYQTKPFHEGKWEAHKKFIDIQYIIRGVEHIFYTPLEYMVISEPYNQEKDIMFLRGEGDSITLCDGMFAIFFPTDAHMPGIAVDEPGNVRKVVVKVQCL